MGHDQRPGTHRCVGQPRRSAFWALTTCRNDVGLLVGGRGGRRQLACERLQVAQAG